MFNMIVFTVCCFFIVVVDVIVTKEFTKKNANQLMLKM